MNAREFERAMDAVIKEVARRDLKQVGKASVYHDDVLAARSTARRRHLWEIGRDDPGLRPIIEAAMPGVPWPNEDGMVKVSVGRIGGSRP